MYEFYLLEMVYLQFFENDGNGRKILEKKVKLEQNKHLLVSLTSLLYKMEFDCIPVSEGTENKPDPR